MKIETIVVDELYFNNMEIGDTLWHNDTIYQITGKVSPDKLTIEEKISKKELRKVYNKLWKKIRKINEL